MNLEPNVYTVTVSKREADVSGTVLLTVTVVSSESTEEAALFVVRKLSSDSETSTLTNSEFVSVASPGDIADYDTEVIYPGLYRTSVLNVALPSPTKQEVFLAALMADIEIATGLTLGVPEGTVQEDSFTYTDTEDVSGPFLFAQT